MRAAVYCCALLLALSGCSRSKLDEAKWKKAGADAVLPFKKTLKQTLVAGLERGPVSAVTACRMAAPQLAEEASTDGVRVGRSSLRLRNPDNAPKPWVRPLLEAYAHSPDQREPVVVAIDDETVGYVEPIFVKPLCVACHGEVVAPELEAKLAELYPKDRATGYAPGDLRGVFWAELPRR